LVVDPDDHVAGFENSVSGPPGRNGRDEGSAGRAGGSQQRRCQALPGHADVGAVDGVPVRQVLRRGEDAFRGDHCRLATRGCDQPHELALQREHE
jgi:hypothetical protein